MIYGAFLVKTNWSVKRFWGFQEQKYKCTAWLENPARGEWIGGQNGMSCICSLFLYWIVGIGGRLNNTSKIYPHLKLICTNLHAAHTQPTHLNELWWAVRYESRSNPHQYSRSLAPKPICMLLETWIWSFPLHPIMYVELNDSWMWRPRLLMSMAPLTKNECFRKTQQWESSDHSDWIRNKIKRFHEASHICSYKADSLFSAIHYHFNCKISWPVAEDICALLHAK